MNIIQIVPRLPPAVCGVGDYSRILARALQQNHAITTRFIVADPDYKNTAADLTFPVKVLHARSESALLQAVADSVGEISGIILQFSGYGYSKRGAPLWLMRALKRIRQEYPMVSLVTMFHELYASGPITSSAFWMKPLQQWVLRSIARTSDSVRTNRHDYAQWLAQARRCHPDDVATFPVFSNLGEAPNFRPFADRERRIVLFQPPALSSSNGRDYWTCWKWLRNHWPDFRTVAAGRCDGLPDNEFIERRGYVTVEEASPILQNSMLSIVDYYDGYLAKSGIFAAYAAHGIGCFAPRLNHSEADGIRPSEHYMTDLGAGLMPNLSAVEEMARRLHDWYAPHSVAATAASYAQTIEMTRRS